MKRISKLGVCFGAMIVVSQVAALAMSSAPERLEGVICEVAVIEQDGKTTYEGRVRPEAAMSGTYKMEVARELGSISSKSSTGGSFDAAAGETKRLGSSAVGGGGEGVKVAMTITVDGASMDCPLRETPELTL